MNFEKLTRRAEAGGCAAQTTLGLYYFYGYRPFEVNYAKAFRLLSLAAERGASTAIATLGHINCQGKGAPKDIRKAIDLYERVAEVEFSAAIALGRLYAVGVDLLWIKSGRACDIRSR